MTTADERIRERRQTEPGYLAGLWTPTEVAEATMRAIEEGLIHLPTKRAGGPSSWQEMVAIEPRLATLEADCLAFAKWAATVKVSICYDSTEADARQSLRMAGWFSSQSSCARMPVGHEPFKRRMIRLVGWQADVPELRTTQAYDIAYRRLGNGIMQI